MLHTNASAFPERLYALDVLRGLASLAVVCFHWQHFFFDGTALGDFNISEQPFYPVLGALYRHGALAVHLFFALSGFIFFWLYAKDIASRKTTAWQFFALRFSRLYPLHIATFLLVLALQPIAILKLGTPFVYDNNDWYHAILNVLLVPAWGFSDTLAFNAPVWSVSVEVLLYGVFFISLRYISRPALMALAFIAIGWLLSTASHMISTGLCAFFGGGLALLASESLLRRTTKRTAFLVSIIGLAAAVLLLFFGVRGSNYTMLYINALVFPLLIAVIAIFQTLFPRWLQGWGVVGEISYSTYLLHFPLQVIFILVLLGIGFDRAVFYSPYTFIAYFGALIPLSILSYRFFERPCQQSLRRLMLGRSQKRVRSLPAAEAEAGR